MRKRIRIQKKRTARRNEPREDIKVPQEINSRTKKKLADSAELVKKIDGLLKEASATQKTERPVQSLRYRPQIPNCEGRMIDLSRR